MSTENETTPAAPEVAKAQAATPPAGQVQAASYGGGPEDGGAQANPQGGPKDRGPQGRGGDRGRGPKRRDRKDPVKPPEPLRVFANPPSLRDLDDEIAGELEAAMGDLGGDIMSAESSSKIQQAKAGEGKERKQGKVMRVHGPDVFIDIPGGRSQGLLPLLQFPEGAPQPGDLVDISIEGYDNSNGLLILTRKGAAVSVDWNSVVEGMTVEAKVTETNKGGLSVEVNGIRGFMPISQIDLYRVENAEQFVNQKLLCVVTEVKPDEKNLVVSRRALLEKEQEEKREKLWAELAEGQVREGIVRKVLEFGAFVDLGGADGLLPIREMSWQRVNDPSTLVQIGQKIKVVVLKLDAESRKISLGLKQLQTDPWDKFRETYSVGQIVKGKVTKTMDFGAFVEIEPGIEGLIHISELGRGRVWRVTDVVKPDQEVEAKIVSLDPDSKRIGLSLKAMIPTEKPKVEEPEEEEVEETPKKPAKPRTTPLKGGMGGSGNLFSMPE